MPPRIKSRQTKAAPRPVVRRPRFDEEIAPPAPFVPVIQPRPIPTAPIVQGITPGGPVIGPESSSNIRGGAVRTITSPYTGRTAVLAAGEPPPSAVGQAVGGLLGGAGGALVGVAGGLAATYQQARQTGEGNLFNLASQGISNVLAGAYSGLQQGADIGGQMLGQSFAQGNPAFRFQPTPSAATQPGVVPTTPGGRPLFPGTYQTQEQRQAARGAGAGRAFPQTNEQRFFGGSPDVAQLRTESWAKSVAIHASMWGSQADIPSYTSLQLFIDAQAQLGNVLTPEQATQVLAGLGYKNTAGSMWYKPRDQSYGTGSGAATGGGYGNIIGSGGGGGGGRGGGGTENGFRGGLATGLYQWRIGA